MTTETIHTCSYSCDRPACIRAQRDELAARMTAETSNARGEWVLVPREVVGFLMGEGELQGAWFGETPTGERGQWFWRKHLRHAKEATAPPPAAARGDVPYDRELIAQMLDACGHPKFTLEAYMEQARLLREADNATVANVGTVAARGDVRGLVDVVSDLRHSAVVDDYEIDQIAFLNSIADRIEAALAAEGVQAGEVERRLAEDRALLEAIREAMGGGAYDTLPKRIAALSQQPEARGVVDAPSVDDLSRDAMAALLRSEKVYAKWSDLAADALAVAQAMHVALTEARNVR